MVQNYDNDILEVLAIADPLNPKSIVSYLEGLVVVDPISF